MLLGIQCVVEGDVLRQIILYSHTAYRFTVIEVKEGLYSPLKIPKVPHTKKIILAPKVTPSHITLP